MLELRGITKRFGGLVAVDELSFTVEENSITALIGPNGAGKTTVFNIVMGIYSPDEGDVYFKGRRITGMAPHKVAQLGISRMFQNIRLFPHMTVLENILVAMRYERGESLMAVLFQRGKVKREERERMERAVELLNLTDLVEKKDTPAANLSQGQRKLLEIARALATGAELFLLDEPTSSLSPNMKERMVKTILSLKDMGKTVLFIEHDMEVVREADKVIVLSSGRKIAEGSYHEVMADKKVVEVYLGRE